MIILQYLLIHRQYFNLLVVNLNFEAVNQQHYFYGLSIINS
jgi:hypothetical protein